MNKRREIILAIGGSALAAPLSSFAQQQGKVWRVGFLGAASALGYASQVQALRSGLRELGYEEGKNIVLEFRWAEGKYERLFELAGELIRLKVDVIVTHGTPGSRAAKQATTTIPIVMATSGDAVATGVVTSLAHPTGNITGNTYFSPEISAKRLEILKDIIPHIKRVAVLLNPDNPIYNAQTGSAGQAMQAAAKMLKLELQIFQARAATELDGIFSAMGKIPPDAVMVVDDGLLIGNSKGIALLAEKSRLRIIGMIELADAGGLLGFGVNFLEQFRRAAYFVDRIIKGAKPSELPIEQPTKFVTVINLKTAKTLGIKIPDVVMLRADRVIE